VQGFTDLSIRAKLVLLGTAVSGVAVALVGLLVGGSLWLNERREAAAATLARADLAANGTAAALVFDDRPAAHEALRMFRVEPQVVAATVYDRHGRPFATYRREGVAGPVPGLPGVLVSVPETGVSGLVTGHAVATNPVRLQGERVGAVVVVSDLSRAYAKVKALARATVLAVAASLLLAVALSVRLQRIISTPLLALSALMARVSGERDYALRTVVRGRDELGVLAGGFNDMLAQIQARDDALERHREGLEHTVAQRTRDLAHANRRLEDELKERRRTEALVRGQNAALETLARGEDLPVILGAIARFLEGRVPGAACAIIGTDTAGGALRLLHAGRLPGGHAAALEACLTDPDAGLCDAPEDGVTLHRLADLPDVPEAAANGPTGFWCLPVRAADGRLLGRICLYHDMARPPARSEASLLESAGALVAMALEREAAAAHMERMAHYDGLTGLPNRRMFHDRLEQALRRARRARRPVAVLFLDLDRFKPVNDTLGHHVGDGVLRQVSARLAAVLRQEDTLARLGGDEFTVILETLADRTEAAVVAERMLECLQPPFDLDGQEVVLGGSVGISIHPGDGDDADALVKSADLAMYRAKQEGRNTFRFFAEDMQTGAARRMRLETALRHALARGEFRLEFQPQVEGKSGRLVGAEALLRWDNPELGPVPPDVFVPILEDTGLIFPVGAWVLAEACARAGAWDGAGALRVAVNVSGRQLHYADLPRLVADVLTDSGLAPERLELELTESVVMADAPGAVETFRALTDLGVKLTVDDFGTGYSSLSYLKRFPIHALKIDRSFVQDLTTDEGDRAICAAVISMAHSLGLQVVAEGVEMAEQQGVLTQLGCDLAQGYLFGRPMPPEQFARLAPLGKAPAPAPAPAPA
jgi:diguanylate cyclase (GGDEF)-like protein